MKVKVIQPEAPAAWYAEGLKFTCTQCGNCCTGGPGYVWLQGDELHKIAQYLNADMAEILHRYCRPLDGRVSLKENKNSNGEYDCVFLTSQGGRRICGIYSVRPLQCRTWPFWDGNLAGPKMWENTAEKCPGIGSGKHYSQSHVEKIRDARRCDEVEI